MAILQELRNEQVDEAVYQAAQRRMPLSITIRSDSRWVSLHSRLLGIREGHMLIEPPMAEPGCPPHEFVPAEKVGLSFKLKHHKHICTVTVAGWERAAIGDIGDARVLGVCLPLRMQRLQRRAYERVEVPGNRVVRASFWMGGLAAEPAGASDTPLWSGRVTNLSAGGFQMMADMDDAKLLEVGEVAGVRIVFGAADSTVYADAQFRHVEMAGSKAIMGFQFVGLDHTSEGRRSLQLISAKVGEYQRAAAYGSTVREDP